MSVEMVDVSVSVPKEMNDVRVALVSVVSDLKSGKDFLTTGEENLKKLGEALVGIDQLPADVREKLKESCVCAGLLGGELTGIMLTPSVAPVVPPVTPVVPPVAPQA